MEPLKTINANLDRSGFIQSKGILFSAFVSPFLISNSVNLSSYIW